MYRLQFIVIAVVIAVALGVPLAWRFLAKPEEFRGIPIYSGAKGGEAAPALQKVGEVGAGIEVRTYVSLDDVPTVANWYCDEMPKREWRIENRVASGLQFMLLLKQAEAGVVIDVHSTEKGITEFDIYTSGWEPITLLYSRIAPSRPSPTMLCHIGLDTENVSVKIDGVLVGSTSLILTNYGETPFPMAFRGSDGVLTWENMKLAVGRYAEREEKGAGEGNVAIYNGRTDWSGIQDFRPGDVLEIALDDPLAAESAIMIMSRFRFGTMVAYGRPVLAWPDW